MQTASFIYLLIVLVLLAPAIFYAFRQKGALANVVVWLAVFAGLMWGYTFYSHRTQTDPLAETTTTTAPLQQPAEPRSTPDDNTTPPTPPAETDPSESPVRNL